MEEKASIPLIVAKKKKKKVILTYGDFLTPAEL